MKTAISIPDPVFQSAEAMARRLGLSRSEFYARAVAAYVSRYDETTLTEQLNAVYAKESSLPDPALAAAQAHLLDDEGW
jgi:hypothetical protein